MEKTKNLDRFTPLDPIKFYYTVTHLNLTVSLIFSCFFALSKTQCYLMVPVLNPHTLLENNFSRNEFSYECRAVNMGTQMLPILAECDVFHQFSKQKTKLNFTNKTDGEFILFLLDTTVSMLSVGEY